MKKYNKVIISILIIGIVIGITLSLLASELIKIDMPTTNKNIIINDNVKTILKELYINNTTEFAACLDINVENQNINTENFTSVYKITNVIISDFAII